MACLLFAGELDAHSEDWGSPVTSSHGRAAHDFESSSAYTQEVQENTHESVVVLDQVFTDVPDTVGVIG